MSHSTDIGSKSEYIVDVGECVSSVRGIAKVADQEFIGFRVPELWIFKIHSTDAISVVRKKGDQVRSNETACTCNENPRLAHL